MPRVKARKSGQQYELGDNNFKAKGGEGSIYIVGDVVCKICEPGAMIPESKFQELAVLDHPRIIRPEDILLDGRKHPVGYTMKLVPGNAMPLAQILTKAYQQRENVTQQHKADLVAQIADGLRFVHSHPGYLQVDGNELNYMVTSDHKEVYFIDVNSFETPSHPADAIMASIRDWSIVPDAAGRWPWSQMSDWYSFAIISWYLFTAIHPYKGFHPDYPNKKTFMQDQMKANISVLHPKVEFPVAAVFFPFEDFVPGGKDGAYMQWYRAIFVDGKRLAAPTSFQAQIVAAVAKVREIIGSNNFVMTMIQNYVRTIVGHFASGNRTVVMTNDQIWVDNNPMPKPEARSRVGFTPKGNVPVLATLENGDYITLQDLDAKTPIRFDGRARDIMACEGRLYALGENDISEVEFVETGSMIFATLSPVAQIMPNATQMFQGVAFQDMFGAHIASIFPAPKHHRQIRIKELAGFQITDAKYEGNVLMVVAMERQTGQYSRFIFRFASDWSGYDCRIIDNITPTGINFTVSQSGICVCITEEEKVELFPNAKGSTRVDSITDPAIVGDMRLCHSGKEVRFAHGTKLYRFSMK